MRTGRGHERDRIPPGPRRARAGGRPPGMALLGLALLWAPSVAPAPARADTTAAKEEFFIGEAYYRKGDYRAAADHYQRAYAAKPHPAVLYNIGECYELLGELEQAADFYVRYLDGLPAARDRAKVEAKLARFRSLPSRVSITSTPPGAAVAVDGQPRGAAPLALELPPGDHQVEASFPDRGAQSRQVTCGLGRPAFVSFSFSAGAGRLAVRSSFEGAEVRLDGKMVGYTPYESDVSPGRHVVDLGLYGYRPVRREVVIAPAETTTIVERLQRLEGADQLDLRRDSANPFAETASVPGGVGKAAAGPPTAGPGGAKPGRSFFVLGGLGGGYLHRGPRHAAGMGGVLAGILSSNGAAELAVEVLMPQPVVVDTFMRVGPKLGPVRIPFKMGLVVEHGSRDAVGEAYTRLGFSFGLGLSVDLGRWLALYAQVGVNLVLPGGEYDDIVQVPATAGLVLKL